MITVGGGLFRSRKIEVPTYLEVPTKSIVRLGIGNALSAYLEDANVLDLFAGSGAVGIELLSRGASSCVFCDSNKEAIQIIQKNLANLKINGSSVLEGDYKKNLDTLKNNAKKFSIVFIDPPYKDKEAYEYSFHFVLNHDLLKENGIIVIEYENDNPIKNSGFQRERVYHYGRTHVAIYWR